MKRINKLFAVLAALTILIASFGLIFASAANVNYSVTSASGAKGDTVTVSLKVTSSVGVMGSQVSVNFDSSKLQYVGYTGGGMFISESIQAGTSSILCTGINMSDSQAKKSGTLVNIKFKILASSGDIPLTVVPSKDAGNHMAVNLEKLTPVASNGKISVTKPVTGITLSPASMNLKKGATGQLTAAVSPSDASNKTVTYSSSNTRVATVSSSGKVTAVGGGTATITAKAGGKSATCKVTVTVPQTGITVSGNASRSVGIGATLKLSAVKVPADTTDNYSVSWSSEDTKIATVSADGTVKGIAVGTTKITAKSNNWTAVYTVTVTEKATEPSTDAPTETPTDSPTEPSSDETSPSVTPPGTIIEPNENPSNNNTAGPLAAGPITEKEDKGFLGGFFAGISEKFDDTVNKFSEKMNDENNKVTRPYHYGMIAAATLITAVISVTVTYFITSGYYKNKEKKKIQIETIER